MFKDTQGSYELRSHSDVSFLWLSQIDFGQGWTEVLNARLLQVRSAEMIGCQQLALQGDPKAQVLRKC